MRILIGTYEICGWISLFQKEFNRLGHQCETLVKTKNYFYSSSEYTYNASRYHLKIKSGNKYVTLINDFITKSYLNWFLRRSSKKYDLVIYIWETVLPTFSDVKVFRENGAKIIFLFAGSDIRTFSIFSKVYDVSHWKFPDYWVKEDTARKKIYVEIAEKYADLIYSVPDQAGLQSKPYYHLQIPIDLSKFIFNNNYRKIPNVLHLPSDPWKKGTDIIEKTINELISEGIKINFFSYRNVKHDEIPLLLQNMDILVDQIVFHGPAVLSFEAMAAGCAVATKYIEASPACFRPPVWSIDAYNIKSRLAELFSDFELQQKLIVEGRRYVEKHNNSGKVTADILENLNNPKTPDYKI